MFSGRRKLMVSALAPIAAMCAATASVEAQVTPMGDLSCGGCNNYIDPEYGSVHHFPMGLQYYCYQPHGIGCHAEDAYYTCGWFHDPCWGGSASTAGQRDELFAAFQALRSPQTTNRVELLQELLNRQSGVLYFAADRNALQAIGCDGRTVVLNIPLYLTSAERATLE